MPTDFSAEAPDWDRPHRVERARAVANVIRAALPLTLEMDTLDYGCGTGLLGMELAPHVGVLTLADTAPGMVQAARERLACRGDPRQRAVRLDLLTDPATAQWDLAVSLLALHHVPDVPALLAALHEALRPGGYVALADLDTEDGHFHDHVSGFDGHLGFDRRRFSGWLTDAGFGGVSVRTAYVERMEDGPGQRDYPIFLATARA